MERVHSYYPSRSTICYFDPDVPRTVPLAAAGDISRQVPHPLTDFPRIVLVDPQSLDARPLILRYVCRGEDVLIYSYPRLPYMLELANTHGIISSP